MVTIKNSYIIAEKKIKFKILFFYPIKCDGIRDGKKKIPVTMYKI